jgi:hypothetical protein
MQQTRPHHFRIILLQSKIRCYALPKPFICIYEFSEALLCFILPVLLLVFGFTVYSASIFFFVRNFFALWFDFLGLVFHVNVWERQSSML